jgi:hypothetical protein
MKSILLVGKWQQQQYQYQQQVAPNFVSKAAGLPACLRPFGLTALHMQLVPDGTASCC